MLQKVIKLSSPLIIFYTVIYYGFKEIYYNHFGFSRQNQNFKC